MKPTILIILACICGHAYAQPVERLQASSTKFSPFSEKIKKLPSASSFAKMKPQTGFFLSSAKISATNNWNLIFSGPEYVTSQEVRFDRNSGSAIYNPILKAVFPENVGGVYVFELNVALHKRVTVFNFQISCEGNTQVVSLANTQGEGMYRDNKLVFAITIPNSSGTVNISSNSADWFFRNCEITPMK